MSQRIAVLGLGYLGATHAACMAELGHDVIGVETDEAKVAKLRVGELPFFEPGLPEILVRNVESGRLRFTSSYAEAAAFADVFFLAVGTPQEAGGLAADLTHVNAVIDVLAPLLAETRRDLRQVHRSGRDRRAAGSAGARTGTCR